ncbi:MarR family winged helix-turn-helix transcriptional regulator [Lignipirellula cremea]|uniref:HTH-type transcriptional regulator MhqR n=1 Tax=Lignipirellula cremea TaxID=2528010 RepID=A0A518DTR2_9BACT|nr:MarR family transcriptional regulator [Lignipirellula cremea]QDU95208.1 HTH-type transcriptional regulator MhqR [Lignipirellula cremea]
MAGKLEQDLKKKRDFESVQQAAVIGLLRTNDLFQYRFTQLFREYGLNQPQYNVLRILRGEGAPLPCLEIASRLITIAPAITSLIDKLEARELVTRERCNRDRRIWYVDLTAAGSQLLASMDERVMSLHESLCRGLSADECGQLVALLEKARSIQHDGVD